MLDRGGNTTDVATSAVDKTLLAQFVSAGEIGDGDTPVPCYVVHHLEMGVSVRQRLLGSEEAMATLTQIVVRRWGDNRKCTKGEIVKGKR